MIYRVNKNVAVELGLTSVGKIEVVCSAYDVDKGYRKVIYQDLRTGEHLCIDENRFMDMLGNGLVEEVTTLDELLDKITPESRHDEIGFGVEGNELI